MREFEIFSQVFYHAQHHQTLFWAANRKAINFSIHSLGLKWIGFNIFKRFVETVQSLKLSW